MILHGSPLNGGIPPAILLNVALLGSTLDCNGRMHYFLLLYSLAVLLLVILPDSFFECGTSWYSFQFSLAVL